MDKGFIGLPREGIKGPTVFCFVLFLSLCLLVYTNWTGQSVSIIAE